MNGVQPVAMALWRSAAPVGRRPRKSAVDTYISTGIMQIPGWFSRTDAAIFTLIDEIQRELGLQGDLLEIGVYLGKCAVLLGYLRGVDERLVVCDPFEAEVQPELNRAENSTYYSDLRVDGFVRNYQRFHDELPEIIVEPSSQLRPDELGRTFRFIHVDGSHLFDEVRADIELTRKLLKPGGVVSFDDVFAPHAPGVAAATWQACANAGLTPLCVSGKLYAMWEGDSAPFIARLRELAEHEPLVAFETAQVNGRDLLWTLHREPRWRGILEAACPPAAKPLARAAARRFRDLAQRITRSSA